MSRNNYTKLKQQTTITITGYDWINVNNGTAQFFSLEGVDLTAKLMFSIKKDHRS